MQRKLRMPQVRWTSLNTKPLQFMDLKHLADLEYEFRQECKAALIKYKKWKSQKEHTDDEIQKRYSDLQGQNLRTQVTNAIHMYWTVRVDYRAAFLSYTKINH